jgi:hypothetical protein
MSTFRIALVLVTPAVAVAVAAIGLEWPRSPMAVVVGLAASLLDGRVAGAEGAAAVAKDGQVVDEVAVAAPAAVGKEEEEVVRVAVVGLVVEEAARCTKQCLQKWGRNRQSMSTCRRTLPGGKIVKAVVVEVIVSATTLGVSLAQ